MITKTKEFFKEGQRASRGLSVEEQNCILKNKEEELQLESEEKIQTLKLHGSLIEKEIRDQEAEMQRGSHLTELEHKQSYVIGVFLIVPSLIGFAGEACLIWLTIKIFQVGRAEALIASSILIFGFLAFETYLSHIAEVFPDMYQRYMLYASFAALICFLVGLFLLAELRGSLFSTQNAIVESSSLDVQVEGAKRFYDSSTQTMGWVMKLISLVGMITCGLCLHLGIRRLIVSGLTLKRYRKVRHSRKKQAALASEIKEWELRPERAIRGFKAGMISGEEEKTQSNWEAYILSPQAIIVIVILALIIITMFIGQARAAEGESVFVLFDLSKSSAVANFKGEEEFKKNVSMLKEIVGKLKAGSSFKILGITERSFSFPHIILETRLPDKGGFFQEKSAKAKLKLIHALEKMNLQAMATSTDLFGAICLAAQLFPRNNKTKKLIILSDMRQCGRDYNLEKFKNINDKILNEIKGQGLIPSLQNVKVYAMGVHSFGRSEAYYNRLKLFWTNYFKQGRAELVSYTMNRRWKNE